MSAENLLQHHELKTSIRSLLNFTTIQFFFENGWRVFPEPEQYCFLLKKQIFVLPKAGTELQNPFHLHHQLE